MIKVLYFSVNKIFESAVLSLGLTALCSQSLFAQQAPVSAEDIPLDVAAIYQEIVRDLCLARW
jgi:hypothetical protein